jgi:hypothetical protein
MTGANDRKWLVFGAILIGLAIGQILYLAFAPLPVSQPPATWMRLVYVGLPAWVAINIERQGLRRLGWAILSIGALATWGLEGLLSPTPRAVTGDLLQVQAGTFFVRGGAPVEVRFGALAFVGGLAAACLRAGSLYWLSVTLARYAPSGVR